MKKPWIKPELFKMDLAKVFGGPGDGLYETITQPLYDTVDFHKERHLQLFQHPIGPKKPIGDTNMFFPAALPRGQAFIVRGITLQLLQPKVYDPDCRKFYLNGYATFQIGAKNYLWLPTREVSNHDQAPAINIKFQIANGKVTTTADALDSPAIELAPHNLLLVPEQPFKVAISELKPLKYPARVRAILHGQLTRSVC